MPQTREIGRGGWGESELPLRRFHDLDARFRLQILRARSTDGNRLEFSRNPKHVSPPWPEGYWPHTPAPPDEKAWDKSVRGFRADVKAMQKLVADPANDLFAPFEHGDGQTLLREALLLADHNAYHIGQLVLLRRLLGAW